jgi:endonuclease III
MARPPPRRARAAAEQARIETLFARFEAEESDPRTELHYTSAYTLVVAVALSAQATDVSVNKATARLFAEADTPAAMLALGEVRLKEFISSIGLFNTKAKNVIRMAEILIAEHAGEVPLERAALQALPGVGRKTASVVLNELGIEPAIAVDTHVFRVSHRLGLARAKTPDKVEAELMSVIPRPYLTRAHHWLILHGRYVCVARRPKCAECLVADLCSSPDRLNAA